MGRYKLVNVLGRLKYLSSNLIQAALSIAFSIEESREELNTSMRGRGRYASPLLRNASGARMIGEFSGAKRQSVSMPRARSPRSPEEVFRLVRPPLIALAYISSVRGETSLVTLTTERYQE